MESYSLLSERVHLCLYLNIYDGAALKSRLISAGGLPGASGKAERERVNFAFVDASMVSGVILVWIGAGVDLF